MSDTVPHLIGYTAIKLCQAIKDQRRFQKPQFMTDRDRQLIAVHRRKNTLEGIFRSVKILLLLFGCLLPGRSEAGHDMRFERVAGEVTTNEYRSFIEHLEQQLPPTPSNNIGNLMVYERVGGATLHGMQTFFSFTHDKRVLDKAIEWSDAFLHARNDPVTGRMQWSGKRELCWPNKETNDVIALYSGAENGDVIEHIVNTAKLILEDSSLWNQTAPPDAFGFGATYLDRAKTYVRECQRSAETTIVPWYLRNTRDGYRLYRPESPAYVKFFNETGPLPWNQQQCVVGGLLRLAQCHRLLNDGNTNIVFYEQITRDAAAWFFENAKLVSVNGKNCYDWRYLAVNDPEEHREDTGHSFYDMYVLRAYDAHLGVERVQLQRLINTALFVINRGSNLFGGYVNGVTNQYREGRKFLHYPWIEMSVLDKRLYELTANAVLVSHEFYDNIPVEAAVLYAKHYWATHEPEPEVVDNAKPAPARLQSPSRHDHEWPVLAVLNRHRLLTVGITLLCTLGVTLLLKVFRRSKTSAVSKNQNS